MAVKLVRSKRISGRVKYPMNASTTIEAGDMVMLDADRMARVAAALAGNGGVVGVAEKTTENTGADGAKEIEVLEGDFEVLGTTLAEANKLALMYAESGSTIDETQAANEPVAGLLIEYKSASLGVVRINAEIAALGTLLKSNARTVQIWSGPLANLAVNGNVITSLILGYPGKFTGFYGVCTVATTDVDGTVALNLEIDGTNVTGGVLTLAFGSMTRGTVVAATAITAADRFNAASLIDLEAASSTAYTDGEVNLFITVEP